MNNIQKAFKAKAELGLRSKGSVQHLANGTPTSWDNQSTLQHLGGFVTDRLQAAKTALTPSAPKVMNTLQSAGSRIDNAIEASDPQVAPAPAPEAPIERPAIRFANGGGLRHEGLVRGPGTGTSDSVPAMISKGEYVLPADTVRHVGKENLDELKDATHTPVGLRQPNQLANGGALSGAWDWAKNAAGNTADTVKGWGASGDPAAPATAAPATPAAAPGAAPTARTIQPGDWRSPSEPAATAANEAGAASESTGLRGAVSTAGKWVRTGGNVAGGLIGAGTAAAAAQDMNQNGANADNATKLAGGAALTAGSVMPYLGAASSAPLAATVGTAALVGNQLGHKINETSPRLSEALASPGNAVGRWWDTGSGLRPEKGAGHLVGDTYNNDSGNPNASLDRFKAAPTVQTPAQVLAAQGAEDAAFNKHIADRGAGDVAMSTENGVRTLGNMNGANPYDRGGHVQPISAEQALGLRAGRDAQEAGLQARYAKEAATTKAEQLAATDKFNKEHGDEWARGIGPGKGGADQSALQAAGGNPHLAAAIIAARTAEKNHAASIEMGMRGQDVTSNDNKRTVDASMYGADSQAANARSLRQFESMKLGVEQGNKNREFGLQSTKANAEMKNAAETELQKNLEGANVMTGPDGKPTFDANAVASQRQYIDRGIARLGANGAHEVSPIDQQRLIAGGHLLSKVQNDATNWPIPWKPDYLKTMDASDLIGMTRLKNGDAKLKNGNVIPGRYIDTEGADRIGGVPTNRYDMLFNKGK